MGGGGGILRAITERAPREPAGPGGWRVRSWSQAISAATTTHPRGRRTLGTGCWLLGKEGRVAIALLGHPRCKEGLLGTFGWP